jgi:hypothetical protein
MHESLRSNSRLRGLRPAARPLVDAATAAAVPDIYLRPNTDSTGSIPSSDPITSCPDIWITQVPVSPASLTTATSYANSSGSSISLGGDANFVYVRGKNGATAPLSRTVQLYYAPSAIIQWPGNWVNNQIPTDQGPQNFQTNITNLASGAIGVADNVFQWTNVQPPSGGSDHYCLFAQLNDASGTLNPFPNVETQVDMAALVRNNLLWGWRNTQEVSGSDATWTHQMGLSIPASMASGSYFVFVNNKGFLGWQVSFVCSQTDANGTPIQLPKTVIQQDNELHGVVCQLNSGFNASVTVSMFQGSAGSAPFGSRMSVKAAFQPNSPQDVARAFSEGLVDSRLQRHMAFTRPPGVTPNPWLGLGDQNYHVGSAMTGNSRRRR